MIKLYNCLGSAMTTSAQNEGDAVIGSPPDVSDTTRKSWLLNMLIAIFFLGASNSWSQVSVTASAGTTGPSPYATVSAAFAAINAGTHQGVITLSVTGNTTEPAATTALLKSASPSSYSAISIRPSGGSFTINSAAAPTANRGVIELNGADNVTIDGDDPATAGTRNLTIMVSTNTATGTAAVRLSSSSTTGLDGADNNTIKNCNITGGRSTAISTTLSYGINMSNYSTTSMTTGAYSSINTLIENNIITRAYHGVYANGASATYPNTGTIIRNNVIGSAVSADNIGNRGIYLTYSAATTGGALIEGNDIRVGDYGTTGYSATVAGIEIGTVNYGFTINKNNIHDINQPSTGGYGAHGIFVTGSGSNTLSTITNNFIRDIKMVVYQTSATSTFIPTGVFFTAGATNVKFSHNTIVQNPQLGSGANYSSFGVNASVSGVTFSQFTNNIVINNATSTTAYGFYTAGTGNISGGIVNNNDYYVPGGNVGYYNGAARLSLSAWQSATAKDSNSFSVAPSFVSATDLHIPAGTATLLESGGAPVATTGVTVDYDDDARPGPAGSVNGGGTNPDIGADEFDGIAPSCFPPTSLVVSALTDSSFTVSWTAASPVPANGYQYEVRTSGAAGSGGVGLVTSGTTASVSQAFSGLVQNTSYSIYVRSSCASDFSSWAAITAATICTPVSAFPWSENFDSMATIGANVLPACWAQQTGSSTWTTANAASQTYNDPRSTPNYLTIYYGATPDYVWTPALQLSAGQSYDFTFYYIGDNTAGWNAEVLSNTAQSATGAATVGTPFVLPATTTSQTVYTKVVRSFTPAATGTYYFGIKAFTSTSAPWYLGFDDFSVALTPSCVAPTVVTSSVVSATSATISWTASVSAPANGYEYYISTSPTAPTAASPATGSVGAGITTATDISLSPDTVYYAWVRAVCNGSDSSAWEGPTSFRTYCSPVASFSENFDGVATPALPSCWGKLIRNAVSASNVTTTTTNFSAPNGVYLYNEAAGATADIILVSPNLSNLGAGTHQLRFVGWNVTASQDIVIGTLSGSGPTAVFTPLQTVDLTATKTEYVVSFAGYSGTDTFIGLRRLSTSTYTSVYVDNVVWEVIPTCFIPTAVTISNASLSGATLNWTAPTQGTPVSYEYEVRTSGAAGSGSTGLAASGSVNAPTTTAVLSGLPAQTQYIVYVRTVCGVTDASAWTTGTPFLTGQCAPTGSVGSYWITNFTTTGATANVNNTSGASTGGFGNYYDTQTITSVAGQTVTAAISTNTGTHHFYIWVDFNNDLDFNDAGETLVEQTATYTASYAGSFTIPASAPVGTFRMRISNVWSGTTTPCGPNTVGEYEDYKLVLTTPPPAIATITPGTICSADLSTTVISLTGSSFTGATAVTLGGSPVLSYSVINDTTIEVNLAPTAVGGNFEVTTPYGTGTSATSLTINTNPTVAPITGPSFVCMPNTNTITLSSATPTGVWSSSDVDIATVSVSGVVTPVMEGDVIISYTVTDSGCSTTQTYAVSVNEPVVISSSTATQTVVTGDNTFFTVVASGTPVGDDQQLTYQWEILTDDPETEELEYTPLTNGAIYGGTNTATLTLTNVPDSLNESLYHVIITGACNVVESDLAVLIVGETGIDDQPENADICEGVGTATFTVVASEDVTAYQWEEDQGGDNWLPITNGGVYSGATSASLTLTGIDGTYSGYKYRVTVTGIGSATSNPAILTIIPSANITTDPSDASVCYTGGSASFTVAANNAISFAWEYSADGGASWNAVANGVPTGATYTGAATSTLNVTTTAATPASGTYSYRAVANSANGCSGDFSNAANLLINTPAITSQPTATTVVAGNTATFTVATSAPSPTYQWQYATVVGGPYTNVANAAPAGVTYSGADTATLSVIVSNSAVASTARFYRAIVSSPVECSVTSNPAQLTITVYCASNATSTSDLDIAQVTFGPLTNPATPPSPLSNNATATATYTDFTGLAPQNFTQGTTYPIVVKQVNRSTTYYVSWTKVFFDWNKDGDFSDAGEAFNGADGPATFPADGVVYSSNITVPLSALPGTTRMRVVLDESGTGSTTPLGCGPYTWGETEDYTINILPAPACDGAPVAGTATSSTQNICISGTATLSVSGYSEGVTGIVFQWYDSAGLISGATGTTYTTPVLTSANTYYVAVTCTSSGQTTNSNSVTINVNNPTVVSTAGASRCGTGVVDLTATGSEGSTINWYAAATGGSPLYTGSNFTTPTISSTTTYYAEASIGGTGQSYGRLAPAAGDTGSTTNNWGIVFNVNTPTTLQSVDVYALTGGTINVKIMNAAMTTELFSTGNVTVTAGGTTTPNVIPLNFTLPIGTGYRIVLKSFTGANLVRSTTANAFPYNGGELSVTASEWGGTTTANYYYFYNLRSAGCTSPRTAVTATVTTAPAVTLSSSSATICEGASTTPPVQITAGTADYDTFTWSPSAGVSGTSDSGYTFNPTATTVYTLTASQTGGSQCQNTVTFTVTVNPLPSTVTITPDNATLCSNDATGILLTANDGNVPVSVVSGTATTTTIPNTTASTLGPNPLQDYYGGTKQQWIYTASELTALGFVAGSSITSFSLDLTTADAAVALNNLVIKMKNTTKTSFTSTTNWETGLTTVRPAATYTPVVGLNNFALPTPFVWNGTGSLIIEMNYSNNNGGVTAATNSAKYSPTAFVSTIFYRVDSATAATVDGFTGTATATYSLRNNVVFQLNNPTSITWTSNVPNSLFTNAAGTVPYTGTASTTVYAKPTTSAVITATATSTAGCFVTDQTNVNVSTATTWYADVDGDGYGSPTAPTVLACTQPANTSANNTDCNDGIAAINPGAPELLYDGVDNNCNNQLDEGNQLTTQLLPQVCNTTLSSIGSLIGITTVSSAITMYRIRVTNGAQVQIIERSVPHFTLPQLPSYQYATTYTVEIELQRNGVWLGYYGPSCTVSSPAVLDADGSTQVSPSQCGITLARINTLIATTSLQGVTGYRFRVTNITTGASGPNVIQTIDRTNHWFSLPMLTQYNYGSTYRIEVAIKTNGVYSGFGAPCEVSSPAAPTLINCGGVVATQGTLIAATSLQGATQYRFQVVRMSDNATTTIDRNTNSFSFAMVPGYTPAAQYAVRVAVMTVGTWSPFGDACEITSPGSAARFVEAAEATSSNMFKATAYPNPFASTFAVDVTSSISEQVQIRVYDMTGKLIETREANASDLRTQQVGDRYAAGVYNVIVTQGATVKTLRVIKR